MTCIYLLPIQGGNVDEGVGGRGRGGGLSRRPMRQTTYDIVYAVLANMYLFMKILYSLNYILLNYYTYQSDMYKVIYIA